VWCERAWRLERYNDLSFARRGIKVGRLWTSHIWGIWVSHQQQVTLVDCGCCDCYKFNSEPFAGQHISRRVQEHSVCPLCYGNSAVRYRTNTVLCRRYWSVRGEGRRCNWTLTVTAGRDEQHPVFRATCADSPRYAELAAHLAPPMHSACSAGVSGGEISWLAASSDAFFGDSTTAVWLQVQQVILGLCTWCLLKTHNR
jgi:hypothetical protein